MIHDPTQAKPVFAKMAYKSMPVVNSLGPLPAARYFKAGDEVLVRFKSGKHTIGRVMLFEVGYPMVRRLHIFFSTGRGSKTRKLEEDK